MVPMMSYDREQVNAMLRKMQGDRSLRSFAKDLKISAAYLSDVLRDSREPGPKILRPLHLRRIKTTTIIYIPESGTRRKRTAKEAQ
jgi:hypothetical protein